MSKTHYQVLGVNELAGSAKIKRHYYELCKKYHPDVSGGDAGKMVSINEAYRVLSDTTLKSAYDRELAAQRREAAMSHTTTAAKASQQPVWQTTERAAAAPVSAAFRHANQPSPKKKSAGWAWFMALGGAAAVLIIAVSYLAPFPKAASATETPVATTDTNQTTDTTPAAPASDQTAQTTDTAPAPTVDPTTTDTTTTPADPTAASSTPTTTPVPTTPTQTQPTTTTTPHKHRTPLLPFWYTQNND